MGDSKRIAVYGGSFNPPHVGHVLAVVWALSTGEVDEVLVVPTFQHPFAKELVPFEARFAMSALAMGWVPGVTVSRLEEELGGESRTLRTLEKLRSEHPSWSLRLLVGADILLDAGKWYAFDRVTRLAPPLVIGRLGYDVTGVEPPSLPEVSSTAIRDAVAAGRGASLRRVVPASVLAYIAEHALYVEGV